MKKKIIMVSLILIIVLAVFFYSYFFIIKKPDTKENNNIFTSEIQSDVDEIVINQGEGSYNFKGEKLIEAYALLKEMKLEKAAEEEKLMGGLYIEVRLDERIMYLALFSQGIRIDGKWYLIKNLVDNNGQTFCDKFYSLMENQ
ncbi:hypothetical protein [Anaeromicropila populeti]|uniref:Uncharacterized protein n=1 Tax=Anaeromicropila populeti TaxID=37658 RepID=A0A1I6I6D1_9FIRM|nr:hypothetical protein [Anaeromicropila populeti]SFR62188.1 hypothetical protein SAMN05661086_00458 [Anaeromicropila populeti]